MQQVPPPGRTPPRSGQFTRRDGPLVPPRSDDES